MDIQQLSLIDWTAEDLEPGISIGHSDFPDFRGVYVGPGRREGIILVKVVAGWTCEPPASPVSIPLAKLEVL